MPRDDTETRPDVPSDIRHFTFVPPPPPPPSFAPPAPSVIHADHAIRNTDMQRSVIQYLDAGGRCRRSTDELAAVPPAASLPAAEVPRVSPRQAGRMLANALVTALKERPQDFWFATPDHDPMRVRDRATGQVWDFTTGSLAYSDRCSCRNVGGTLSVGLWTWLRVKWHIAGWLADHHPPHPAAEEAVKLERANQAARQKAA